MQPRDLGLDLHIVQTGKLAFRIGLDRLSPVLPRLFEPTFKRRQRGQVVLDQGTQSRVRIGGRTVQLAIQPPGYILALPTEWDIAI